MKKKENLCKIEFRLFKDFINKSQKENWILNSEQNTVFIQQKNDWSKDKIIIDKNRNILNIIFED